MQYMDMKASSDAVEKILGGVFVMWSSFDETDNSVSGRQLNLGVVKAESGTDLKMYLI